MSRSRKLLSVPTEFPARGAFPASGTKRLMYSSTCACASASVVPCGRSSSSPEVVCISRTKSPICSTAASGGVMMMSIPSSRACNWESVTITAISISASSARLRPVISQSIHTMGSFACVLTRPGYRRTAAAGAASAGLGERVWRVSGCLCARTGGPPAPLSLLLCLAPANLAALLRFPLSFVVGGALYVVQNQGVHDVPRRGRADPVGAATVTLTARRRPVSFFLGIVPLSGCSVAGPRRHLLLSHGFLCRSAARGERGRPHHPDGRSAPPADRGWIRRGAYSLGQRE